MAEVQHRILATPASLKRMTPDELRELIDRLIGHGGYNPFWPCDLCKLKDEARAELESRE